MGNRMSDDSEAQLRALEERLQDAELRCKIMAAALRGALGELNPNARIAARRFANTATLANCPPEDRPRRIGILREIIPDAPRGPKNEEPFIPGPPDD